MDHDPPRRSRLSDIQERSEKASVTSSSDESDDIDVPEGRRGGLRQTDKELLEKTLNEYVNRASDSPKPYFGPEDGDPPPTPYID